MKPPLIIPAGDCKIEWLQRVLRPSLFGSDIGGGLGLIFDPELREPFPVRLKPSGEAWRARA